MRFLDASIRILAEENEKKILCDKACLAVNSRGRVREEVSHYRESFPSASKISPTYEPVHHPKGNYNHDKD